jgi:purine-binding chemotaxis protein CheW
VTLGRAQEETLELFTFSIGAHQYAVDLLRVDEVLPPMEVTEAEDVRPPVLGCVWLRGEALPVVELRRCLRDGPVPEEARPGFLVCWLGRRRVAFCIDAVGGVVRVATASLVAPPAGADVSPAVVAVVAQPPGVTFLLDVKALLRGGSPEKAGSG